MGEDDSDVDLEVCSVLFIVGIELGTLSFDIAIYLFFLQEYIEDSLVHLMNNFFFVNLFFHQCQLQSRFFLQLTDALINRLKSCMKKNDIV